MAPSNLSTANSALDSSVKEIYAISLNKGGFPYPLAETNLDLYLLVWSVFPNLASKNSLNSSFISIFFIYNFINKNIFGYNLLLLSYYFSVVAN